MKLNCDKVLTIDNFEEHYASWKGRVLTVMGDYIKVSQLGLHARYFDTIYLFEESAILMGFHYGDLLPECYITTQDGLESECLVDIAPYLFQDLNHLYAVVKRSYRNVDLKRQVIGLTILDATTLTPLDSKYTWPIWESIESIHNGAIIIKRNENSYGLSTVDKFPSCNLVRNASFIKRADGEDNTYLIFESGRTSEPTKTDFSKKLSKFIK